MVLKRISPFIRTRGVGKIDKISGGVEERECGPFHQARERKKLPCFSWRGEGPWLEFSLVRSGAKPLFAWAKACFSMLHMVCMHTRHIDAILWLVAHGHDPCFLMCNPCTNVTHLCVQSMGIQERSMPSIFIRGPSHAPRPPSRSTTIQFPIPMSLLPKWPLTRFWRPSTLAAVDLIT